MPHEPLSCALDSLRRLGPHAQPIEVWHIAIAGRSQTLGRPSGSEKLWWLLRNSLNNGSVCVELCEWNRRWSEFAEFIWRFRPGNTRPKICVYPYSWGAGWGFVQLARELQRRDLSIDVAVLSDPVYRSRWLSLRWLSLSRLPAITVPSNVREVYWFYQRRNLPMGHRVVAEDPQRTKVHDGIEAKCEHSYMDDLPAWHEIALTKAQEHTRRARGAA